MLHIEVAWPRPNHVTDDHLEALGAGLPGFPITIDSGLLLYIRFQLDTDDMADALPRALAVARAAHARAFGVEADPVQVVAAPALKFIPGPLDLVGTIDVARMLDVSRERARQLADRLPAPVGYPSGAPAWVRAAVEQATATWDRRPGRRPKQDPPIT